MTPERMQQIEAIFHDACHLAPGERAAFLDQACAGDQALRREVELLLASDEQAATLIETPAIELAAPLFAESKPPSLTGQSISHYQIISLLGKGGMGEVYQARDTKLDRTVALKILPVEVSADAERMRRFVREAKAASALNHPHVATIYEIGEADGVSFIAMEYIEGQTLAAKINGTPLAISEIIAIGCQIADALDAAHSKGITHRDIKPANVMLNERGQVKVLDFGLAKIAQPQSIDCNISTLAKTQSGAVMGTPQYMSPEQVRGQEADHRSDIFALGLILYEMLSGRRAFAGDTAAEVMSGILNEEPPELSGTNKQISPPLARIVRRCLEKKPERRFQSASDLGFALEALSSSSPASGANQSEPVPPDSAVMTKRSGWRERLAWLVATVAVFAFVLAWIYFSRSPAANLRATRLAIPLPEKISEVSDVSISPDGQYVAFLALDANGLPRLWLRPLNATEAKPLAGTEGAGNTHFWSPDSRFIAFVAGNTLKKVSLTNGASRVICQFNDIIRGGTWNREGVILIGTMGRGLFRVTEREKSASVATALDLTRLESAHRYPQFLPDGQHFLYRVTATRTETAGTYVGTLGGTEKKRLLDGESNAFYATPGWLLFVRGGELMAQRFDADQLQLSSEPVRLGAQARNLNNIRSLAASDNGTLAYDTNTTPTGKQLAWFDRSGKQIEILPEVVSTNLPTSLSPDEKKLAIITPPGQIISILDLTTKTKARFTFSNNPNNEPLWSPDGSQLIWRSYRNVWQVFQKATNGAGDEMLLFQSERPFDLTDWSADGRYLCYDARDVKGNLDLWAMPLFGERQPQQIFKSEANELHGRFSPDCKWLAYTSDESGGYEIYVRTFPDTGGKWQVSPQGGTQPRWRHDGKELFYTSMDRKLMAVDVQAGAAFVTGTPHKLFVLPAGWENYLTGFVVTKDGQRFLLPVSLTVKNTAPLAVVLNWTAEVK